MNLKIFFNMIIAALVVFIVFNLLVPMSVTVVNEGFTEALSVPNTPQTANNKRPEVKGDSQPPAIPPVMQGQSQPVAQLQGQTIPQIPPAAQISSQ